MPKDLIHFTIAEQTAARLSDTRFAPCLNKNRDGLLLGSVFHDAFFYAMGSGAKQLTSLADRFHGDKGQDTFSLIRMQAQHAANETDRSLPAALLVGMISHLCADVALHPLVWHFTGDYYAEDPQTRTMSRQRHRAMESLMDMVISPDKLGRPRYRLRILLRRCNTLLSHGLPINELAKSARMETRDMQNSLLSAWKTFARIQAVTPVPWLAHSLFTLRPYLPNYLAEIATLFYAPQLMKQAKFIQDEISYTHPVTNEKRTSPLKSLIDEAVTQAEALCRQLETTVFDGKTINLPAPGPSLDAGMVGVPTSSMLHYATPPFPTLD